MHNLIIPYGSNNLPPHRPLLPLLRPQQLIRNPLHMHRLDPLGYLGLVLVEDALALFENVGELLVGEAGGSLSNVNTASNKPITLKSPGWGGMLEERGAYLFDDEFKHDL